MSEKTFKDIKVIKITSKTRSVSSGLSLDEKAALFLAGGTILLDPTNQATILYMNPTEENLEEGRRALLEQRDRLSNSTPVKRGSRVS